MIKLFYNESVEELKIENRLGSQIYRTLLKTLFCSFLVMFFIFDIALMSTPINAFTVTDVSFQMEDFSTYKQSSTCSYSFDGSGDNIDDSSGLSCVTLQASSSVAEYSYLQSSDYFNQTVFYTWNASDNTSTGISEYFLSSSIANSYFDETDLYVWQQTGSSLGGFSIYTFIPNWVSANVSDFFGLTSNANSSGYYTSSGSLEDSYNKYVLLNDEIYYQYNSLSSVSVDYVFSDDDSYSFGTTSTDGYDKISTTVSSVYESDYVLQTYQDSYVNTDYYGVQYGYSTFDNSSYYKSGIYYLWDDTNNVFYTYTIGTIALGYLSEEEVDNIQETGKTIISKDSSNSLISYMKKYYEFAEYEYIITSSESVSYGTTSSTSIDSSSTTNSFTYYDIDATPSSYDSDYVYEWEYVNSDWMYEYESTYIQQLYKYSIVDQEKIDTTVKTTTYTLSKITNERAQEYSSIYSTYISGGLCTSLTSINSSSKCYTVSSTGLYEWVVSISTNKYSTSSSDFLFDYNGSYIDDDSNSYSSTGELELYVDDAVTDVLNINGGLYVDSDTGILYTEEQTTDTISLTPTTNSTVSKELTTSGNAEYSNLVSTTASYGYDYYNSLTSGSTVDIYYDAAEETVVPTKNVYDIYYNQATSSGSSTYCYTGTTVVASYSPCSSYTIYSNASTGAGSGSTFYYQGTTSYSSIKKTYSYIKYYKPVIMKLSIQTRYYSWGYKWADDGYLYIYMTKDVLVDLSEIASSGSVSNSTNYSNTLEFDSTSTGSSAGALISNFDSAAYLYESYTSSSGLETKFSGTASTTRISGLAALTTGNTSYTAPSVNTTSLPTNYNYSTSPGSVSYLSSSTYKGDYSAYFSGSYAYYATGISSTTYTSYLYYITKYNVTTNNVLSGHSYNSLAGNIYVTGSTLTDIYVTGSTTRVVDDTANTYYIYSVDKVTYKVTKTTSTMTSPVTSSIYYQQILYNGTYYYVSNGKIIQSSKSIYNTADALSNTCSNTISDTSGCTYTKKTYDFNSGANIDVYFKVNSTTNSTQTISFDQVSPSNLVTYLNTYSSTQLSAIGLSSSQIETVLYVRNIGSFYYSNDSVAFAYSTDLTSSTSESVSVSNRGQYYDYAYYASTSSTSTSTDTGDWTTVSSESYVTYTTKTYGTSGTVSGTTVTNSQSDSTTSSTGSTSIKTVVVDTTVVTYPRDYYSYVELVDGTSTIKLYNTSTDNDTSFSDFKGQSGSYYVSGDEIKSSGSATTLTQCSTTTTTTCYRFVSSSNIETLTGSTTSMTTTADYSQTTGTDYYNTSTNQAYYANHIPNSGTLCTYDGQTNCYYFTGHDFDYIKIYNYSKHVITYTNSANATGNLVTYGESTSSSTTNTYAEFGYMSNATYDNNGSLLDGNYTATSTSGSVSSLNSFYQNSFFTGGTSSSTLVKYLTSDGFGFTSTSGSAEYSYTFSTTSNTSYRFALNATSLESGSTVLVYINGTLVKTLSLSGREYFDFTSTSAYTTIKFVITGDVEFKDMSARSDGSSVYTVATYYTNTKTVTDTFYQTYEIVAQKAYYNAEEGENGSFDLTVTATIVGYNGDLSYTVEDIIALNESGTLKTTLIMYGYDFNQNGTYDSNEIYYSSSMPTLVSTGDDTYRYAYSSNGSNLSYSTSRTITLNFSNSIIYRNTDDVEDLEDASSTASSSGTYTSTDPTSYVYTSSGDKISVNSDLGMYYVALEYVQKSNGTISYQYDEVENDVLLNKDTTEYSIYTTYYDSNKEYNTITKSYDKLDSGYQLLEMTKEEFEEIVIYLNTIYSFIDSNNIIKTGESYYFTQEWLEEMYLTQDEYEMQYIYYENGVYKTTREITFDDILMFAGLDDANSDYYTLYIELSNYISNYYFSANDTSYYKLVRNSDDTYTEVEKYKKNGTWESTTYDAAFGSFTEDYTYEYNSNSLFSEKTENTNLSIYTGGTTTLEYYMYAPTLYIFENVDLDELTDKDIYSDNSNEKYFYVWATDDKIDNLRSLYGYEIKSYSLNNVYTLLMNYTSDDSTVVSKNTLSISVNSSTNILIAINEVIATNDSAIYTYELYMKSDDFTISQYLYMEDLNDDILDLSLSSTEISDLNVSGSNSSYALQFSGLRNYWESMVNSSVLYQSDYTLTPLNVEEKNSTITIDISGYGITETVSEFLLINAGTNGTETLYDLYGLSDIVTNGKQSSIFTDVEILIKVLTILSDNNYRGYMYSYTPIDSSDKENAYLQIGQISDISNSSYDWQAVAYSPSLLEEWFGNSSYANIIKDFDTYAELYNANTVFTEQYTSYYEDYYEVVFSYLLFNSLNSYGYFNSEDFYFEEDVLTDDPTIKVDELFSDSANGIYGQSDSYKAFISTIQSAFSSLGYSSATVDNISIQYSQTFGVNYDSYVTVPSYTYVDTHHWSKHEVVEIDETLISNVGFYYNIADGQSALEESYYKYFSNLMNLVKNSASDTYVVVKSEVYDNTYYLYKKVETTINDGNIPLTSFIRDNEIFTDTGLISTTSASSTEAANSLLRELFYGEDYQLYGLQAFENNEIDAQLNYGVKSSYYLPTELEVYYFFVGDADAEKVFDCYYADVVSNTIVNNLSFIAYDSNSSAYSPYSSIYNNGFVSVNKDNYSTDDSTTLTDVEVEYISTYDSAGYDDVSLLGKYADYFGLVYSSYGDGYNWLSYTNTPINDGNGFWTEIVSMADEQNVSLDQLSINKQSVFYYEYDDYNLGGYVTDSLQTLTASNMFGIGYIENDGDTRCMYGYGTYFTCSSLFASNYEVSIFKGIQNDAFSTLSDGDIFGESLYTVSLDQISNFQVGESSATADITNYNLGYEIEKIVFYASYGSSNYDYLYSATSSGLTSKGYGSGNQDSVAISVQLVVKTSYDTSKSLPSTSLGLSYDETIALSTNVDVDMSNGTDTEAQYGLTSYYIAFEKPTISNLTSQSVYNYEYSLYYDSPNSTSCDANYRYSDGKCYYDSSDSLSDFGVVKDSDMSTWDVTVYYTYKGASWGSLSSSMTFEVSSKTEPTSATADALLLNVNSNYDCTSYTVTKSTDEILDNQLWFISTDSSIFVDNLSASKDYTLDVRVRLNNGYTTNPFNYSFTTDADYVTNPYGTYIGDNVNKQYVISNVGTYVNGNDLLKEELIPYDLQQCIFTDNTTTSTDGYSTCGDYVISNQYLMQSTDKEVIGIMFYIVDMNGNIMTFDGTPYLSLNISTSYKSSRTTTVYSSKSFAFFLNDTELDILATYSNYQDFVDGYIFRNYYVELQSSNLSKLGEYVDYTIEYTAIYDETFRYLDYNLNGQYDSSGLLNYGTFYNEDGVNVTSESYVNTYTESGIDSSSVRNIAVFTTDWGGQYTVFQLTVYSYNNVKYYYMLVYDYETESHLVL